MSEVTYVLPPPPSYLADPKARFRYVGRLGGAAASVRKHYPDCPDWVLVLAFDIESASLITGPARSPVISVGVAALEIDVRECSFELVDRAEFHVTLSAAEMEDATTAAFWARNRVEQARLVELGQRRPRTERNMAWNVREFVDRHCVRFRTQRAADKHAIDFASDNPGFDFGQLTHLMSFHNLPPMHFRIKGSVMKALVPAIEHWWLDEYEYGGVTCTDSFGKAVGWPRVGLDWVSDAFVCERLGIVIAAPAHTHTAVDDASHIGVLHCAKSLRMHEAWIGFDGGMAERVFEYQPCGERLLILSK